MFRSVSIALLLIFAAASAAIAEADHHHAGKHGGIMADTSGHHHVELVTEGQSMIVYVLHSNGKLEDVTNAKATATILSGGKTEKITLSADGDVLKGDVNATLSEGDTVVITLTMPRHKPEQARLKLR